MSKRSLANIAGIVAAATLLSKVFGLLREAVIAASFGVGPVTDAYAIAYVIPGFLLILLGGINGPFHSAIVSVVAKRKKEEIAPLVETVTTLIGIILIAATVAIVLFAGQIIGAFGENLNPETQIIAIAQLRIMAPITVFAAFIGIGFGTLNANDQYWLPSVSPLLSSSAVIVALGAFWLTSGGDISNPQTAITGGMVLAGGTLVGAILQWLIQVPALWKSGLGRPRLGFNFRDPGVRDVMNVLAPATFASGTFQINVYTDLYFAAMVDGAAASLGFANLLVQAPLGIVSNIVLVPFLPIFSRLTEPEQWPELKQRIRQSIVLVGLTMLPMSALFITLAQPIVRVAYERGNFGERDVQIVTGILLAYGLGMFVYLARDVMVRVFYALGDGKTPFNISLVNIGFNALFDWIFFQVLGLGAPGLVIATIGVNMVSLLAMTFFLARKIDGLPVLEWAQTIATITIASFLAGISSWLTLGGLASIFGTSGFLVNLFEMCVAGGMGLVTFALLTIVLKIPEANILANQIRTKLGR
ncbi:MAG: murein biosynthesis integral membrane protein MurJ [Cyanobacteria bacterium J06643_4]